MNTIEIKEIRNAVSQNDDDTEFDLEIKHPDYGWIPYSLTTNDTDNTIDNSALLKLIGSDFTKLSQSEKDSKESNFVRMDRDAILETEVDPIVSNPLRWNAMSKEKQDAWTKYRQDLLDVPQQSGFPHDITFPTKPS